MYPIYCIPSADKMLTTEQICDPLALDGPPRWGGVVLVLVAMNRSLRPCSGRRSS